MMTSTNEVLKTMLNVRKMSQTTMENTLFILFTKPFKKIK